MSKKEDCILHVNILRNKLLEIQDLKTRKDDLFFLRFLRAKKFDQEKSFKLVKNYYFVREKYDIFNYFLPSTVKNILTSGIFEIINPDQLGRTIIIAKAYKWDILTHSVLDLLKAMLIILEAVLEEEETQINGVVLIYDCSGLSWRHCIKFTPNIIYLMKVLLEDTFPARYKEWHIVNVNRLAKSIMMLVYPILSYKIRKRVHIHCNPSDSLPDYLSSEILPIEYGGKLRDNDFSITIQEILEMEEKFRSHLSCWSENV